MKTPTPPPRVTVLQLDTHFPRCPGDIGCVETFSTAPDIRRIRHASVARVVTADLGGVDIAPFIAAMTEATGDIITTSCGFLAPFQTLLAATADRPVVASALSALPRLMDVHGPSGVAVMTFDAHRLTPTHMGGTVPATVIGLPPASHLRRVISMDLPTLDHRRAAAELATVLQTALPRGITALLLECTNLPPFKPAISAVFDGEIVDILTCIEDVCPGAIRPAYL